MAPPHSTPPTDAPAEASAGIEVPAPRDGHPDRLGPSALELGRRIRMQRVARGLTLKDLEARGSISATHISEIERGKASPTVGTLGRIARALDMGAAALLEPVTLPEVSIARAANEQKRRLRWGSATLEALTDPVAPGLLGAHTMTLPGGKEPALTHEHEGEEWITVLSGAAEIRLVGQAFLLHVGDSLHLRARQTHAYANPGTEPAVLLVVCRPRLAF